MKPLRMKKTTPGVNIIIIVFSIIFFVHAIICVFPLFFVIMNSLKTAAEFNASSTALPQFWKFDHFIKVFQEFRLNEYHTFPVMLFNSLWMLVVNVFVNVLSSTLLAYALAKFRFPGKEFLYSLVIFANTIPIIGAGPAGYKLRSDLGMVNNPFMIWLSWAGGFDFAFIVMYGTFKGISKEYSEAAKIDGANNLFVMFRIVLPQAFPSIMALVITQATGVWNDYGTSMIYMREYPTLAYGLYLFEPLSRYESDITGEPLRPIYFAASVVSCLPVIILYAANQKLILTNMTAGGLKG